MQDLIIFIEYTGVLWAVAGILILALTVESIVRRIK
jgi:hypothetical protein